MPSPGCAPCPAGDSVLIGSRNGMTIHFRLTEEELRPLGRTARGVRAMNLRAGDQLVSMDVLPAELVPDRWRAAVPPRTMTTARRWSPSEGPPGCWWPRPAVWASACRWISSAFRSGPAWACGRGSFRRQGDVLVGPEGAGGRQELLLVSERGVIVRMQADAVPQQSRAATGVRLQEARFRRPPHRGGAGAPGTRARAGGGPACPTPPRPKAEAPQRDVLVIGGGRRRL